ncbi:hypothetical protein [Emticicia agri]|uniref:DUF1648 domain-containing protein n=1 Tax=Emticicia agri TaxID=2492393 RepID=A0A4Q5M5C5_9BACT|nr:hypothetical protein [Emticicia agri]RYU97716.1 hypothetical protein EWM59_00920 [Emticicia agri]
MSVSHIFFSFWRKVSMPVLAITLVVCYFIFPDDVAIHHTSSGRPDDYISKQDFFYVAFAIIIGMNFLLNLLRTQVQKINFSKLNANSIWAKDSEALKNLLEAWFNAFIAVINSFMIVFLIALNRINRTEDQKLDINYDWVIVGGAAILLIVLFYLPIRLLYSNPATRE